MSGAYPDDRGLTLMEIITVLFILGILASVAVYRFVDFSGTAELKLIDTAVRKLKARESLVWTNKKISPGGWLSDVDVFGSMEFDLGPDIYWNPAPDVNGGTLNLTNQTIRLNRVPSTNSMPARWKVF